MYAIRSKKTNRWFLGIDRHVGLGSSHYLKMDEQIPMLFITKEMAKIELLTNQMHMRAFDIVEVHLQIIDKEANRV